MLVGRERELELLAGRIAERRPAAVLGEAGVGKTALLRAAAAASGRRVVEGGGLSTLSWLPFLPLTRALGREQVARDAADAAAEVAEVVSDDGVLLLDDLHWADEGTREAIVLLAGRIPLLVAIRRGDSGAQAALAVARDAGFELIPLEPLAAAESAQLVRALRPELALHDVERVVALAGGNPLLLEELARSGEPTQSLKLALAARLTPLSAAAREAMSLLALASHPLPHGAGTDELVEAGLAVKADGGVAIRHALLAETLLEQIEERDRRRLHRRLAKLADDPGAAARHHAAAGERARAHACARTAAVSAVTPGERASHLALAATCADGPDADVLRLEAAAAVAEAGLYSSVEPLLAAIRSDDPLLLAEADFLRTRAAWETGDVEAARASVAAGLARVRGTDTPSEARLRAEEVRLELLAGSDAERALLLGVEAWELAQRIDAEQARTRYVLGTAHYIAARDGWDEHLLAATVAARASGEIAIELPAANNLIVAHESDGVPAEGRRIAGEMIARTRSLRLRAWEQQFRAILANLLWHEGDLGEARELAERLLAEPLEFRTRRQTEVTLAMVLVDVGEHEEAARVLAPMQAEAAPDPLNAWNRGYIEMEAALWSGRAVDAVAAADDVLLLDLGGYGHLPFAVIALAWASLDSGRELPAPPAEEDLKLRIGRGSRPEVEALRLLAAGAPLEAAERFAAAAELWAPYHRRGELRALWGEGEALRRAGETERAIARLEAIEARADALGYAPLAARIRRSLRLAGVRRAAERTRAGALTAREREVLELVGRGYSNGEIARRLGLSRATVAGTVEAASGKLGARTRAQAAALAAEA